MCAVARTEPNIGIDVYFFPSKAQLAVKLAQAVFHDFA